MTENFIQSLDPRVTRLHISQDINAEPLQTEALDQFGTYQVFYQKNDNKPFEHCGIVHAPSLELALMYAKEQYSRRFTCSGMAVAETLEVKSSPLTEGDTSVYELLDIDPASLPEGESEYYEIFHLKKRGKQHEHAGSVEARSYEEAAWKAKQELAPEKPVYNIWFIKRSQLLTISEEDKDIWSTLPDKKYRDAIAYKAGDKLKGFKG